MIKKLHMIWIVCGIVVLLSGLAHGKTYKKEVVENPQEGSAEWIIMKMIEACSKDDFDTFYQNYCHEDLCFDTPKNQADLKTYSWKRCVKWSGTETGYSYFVDKDKMTFKVMYTTPRDFTDDLTQIKFFIHSSKRDNPVPIILKKDKDGKWKVYNFSL